MKILLDFIEKLESNKIWYRLAKVRPDFIMVEISVPGERWEVEFAADGHVEIERFRSDGYIYDEKTLEELFDYFAD